MKRVYYRWWWYSLVVVLALSTGCASLTRNAQTNLSQSETQAKQNSEIVNLAAIQAGQIDKLLSSATNNIDKGFRFQDSGKEVARDTEGNIVYVDVPTANGVIKAPLYVDWSTEVSLNSYVDLANQVEGLTLEVGQLADLQGASNQIYRTTPNRNGLKLIIERAGESVTNAAAIEALKSGHIGERTASGIAISAAIKSDWEGRVTFLSTGGDVFVSAITATGVAVGKLLSSPIVVAGGEALKLLIEKEDKTVETVVVEK